MEAVKSSSTQALQATQASQRTEQKSAEQAQATAASQKTEAQAPPRPTTNTRGESLGQLLNARA